MQTQDRNLIRIGGLSAMSGAVVLLLFLLARPATMDPQDVAGNLHIFAQNAARFQLHGLGSLVSMLLILGGFVGLYHALRAGRGATWARLAFVAAVATAPITLLGPLFDGMVMPAVAGIYVQAPAGETEAALNLAKAFYLLNDALMVPMFLTLSTTFLLFGLALLLDHVYPRWLGWLGMVEGSLGLVVAIALAFAGPVLPAQLLLPAFLFMLLMIVWLVLAGLFTWRRVDAALE